MAASGSIDIDVVMCAETTLYEQGGLCKTIDAPQRPYACQTTFSLRTHLFPSQRKRGGGGVTVRIGGMGREFDRRQSNPWGVGGVARNPLESKGICREDAGSPQAAPVQALTPWSPSFLDLKS